MTNKNQFNSPFESLGFLCWLSYNVMSDTVEYNNENHYNLTYSQIMILTLLYWLEKKQQKVKQQDLAVTAYIRKITISNMIRRLKNLNLILVTINKDDKRAKSLTLTNEGVNYVKSFLSNAYTLESKLKSNTKILKFGLEDLSQELQTKHRLIN